MKSVGLMTSGQETTGSSPRLNPRHQGRADLADPPPAARVRPVRFGRQGLRRARSRPGGLTSALVVTGDLAAAGLESSDVYPVAWAREGGTAVVVRLGRGRAGEVIWFEGVQSTVYREHSRVLRCCRIPVARGTGPLTGGASADDAPVR